LIASGVHTIAACMRLGRRIGQVSVASQSSWPVRLRPWNDGSSYPRAQVRNAVNAASSPRPLSRRTHQRPQFGMSADRGMSGRPHSDGRVRA
jgi:hypothetical protein